MGHFFGEAGIAPGKAGGAWGAPLSFTPSFSGCSLPWLFEVEGSQIQHSAPTWRIDLLVSRIVQGSTLAASQLSPLPSSSSSRLRVSRTSTDVYGTRHLDQVYAILYFLFFISYGKGWSGCAPLYHSHKWYCRARSWTRDLRHARVYTSLGEVCRWTEQKVGRQMYLDLTSAHDLAVRI